MCCSITNFSIVLNHLNDDELVNLTFSNDVLVLWINFPLLLPLKAILFCRWTWFYIFSKTLTVNRKRSHTPSEHAIHPDTKTSICPSIMHLFYQSKLLASTILTIWPSIKVKSKIKSRFIYKAHLKTTDVIIKCCTIENETHSNIYPS